MEDLYGYYLNKLQDNTEDSGLLLSKFYSVLFEQPNSVEIIKMFRHIIKMYGRFNVFNSLVSVYDMGDRFDGDFNRVWGLIIYLCKKQYNTKFSESPDLNEYVKKNEEKIEKAKNRNLKIPNPFKEDNNARKGN